MDIMVKKLINLFQQDLIKFAQDLVRIKSVTGSEGEVAKFIQNKMLELGYDDVILDKLGNVIGVMGNGPIKILYDSHMDTVEVKDAHDWTVDPFGGEIKNGNLYGRGSVDMKGSAAASVYAGYAIKKLGLSEGKTIYVSTSVMEEDYDGEAVTRLMNENNISPNYVVICEPSQLQIAIGHRGRATLKITTKGKSAHGSTPEKGENAIYKMNTIIKRVEELSKKFMGMEGEKGSVAITKIESEAASLNAVPHKCNIYLDRRLVVGEDEKFIEKEMDMLIEGTGAIWEIYDATGTSWRGEPIVLHSFLPAWEMDKHDKLVIAAIETFKQLKDKEPDLIKLGFSTNGVATAGKFGIPTIDFGAGEGKFAHMVDERCPISDIIDACEFYTLLPKNI